MPSHTTAMPTEPTTIAEAIPPTAATPTRRMGAMALRIQTVTGERRAVGDAMPSDTLARLRARIAAAHGIAANTQRLVLDQVTLEEGPQTLATRGIGRESVLMLSLQAPDHLLTERQRAVTAAEAAATEADSHAAEQAGRLEQPRTRLLLHRDDGSAKHWRWFGLSRDAEGDASVSWGKNEDGSNHTLWASCGSAPPKIGEVSGVSADEGPAGAEHGFRMTLRGGRHWRARRQLLLVAAPDAATKEKWVAALGAVAAQREAVVSSQPVCNCLWLYGSVFDRRLVVTGGTQDGARSAGAGTGRCSGAGRRGAGG